MHEHSLMIMSCTFLAVSGATLLILQRIWSFDKRVNDRLSELPIGRGAILVGKRIRPTSRPGTRLRARVLEIAARLLPNDQRERTQLQTRLIHAGIYAPWASGVFLTVKLSLIVVPPLIGFCLGEAGFFDPRKALFWGTGGGAVGIVLPSIWLGRRKRRRQANLCRSLPDFLDLLVACVQSGLSLEAALQRVSGEMTLAYPLLAGELAVVQRQIELGATPDLALRNFAERSDLSSLYSLSTLIEQARRFGTSVIEALRTQAEMLRYQREQRAEELAQRAAVKILFPTLLFIFPAIFVVLVGPAGVQLYEKFGGRCGRKWCEADRSTVRFRSGP